MNASFARVTLVGAFALAPAIACNDKPGDVPAPAASASSAPAASGSAPAPSGSATAPKVPATITQDSLTFMPVGKWDRKEGDKKDYLWWSIRNTAPSTLTSAAIVIYYYDLKQRQIGRKVVESTKMKVPPKGTREMQIGVAKQWEPKGTQYRDAIFTKATFEDGTVYDDPSAAPEQKPYRGAIPVPTPD